MRRFACLTVMLVLLANGLAAPAGFVTSMVVLRSGGLLRSYVVVRPTGATGPLPVLVELQGCCTTPWAELARSGFLAVSRRAILIYPAAYDERWNAGACCGSARPDDVSFVSGAVSRVLATVPDADRSRVFLAGYSNGGRLAYRLTCERPGLFTAVAIFGAVGAFDCPGLSPVPILIAAGTADPELTVPADGIPHMVGGYLEPSVTGEAQTYATANGCAGPPGPSGWTGCSTGDPVTLLLYPGGDHAWPPGLAVVIWRFFTGTAV
jgi:polyhydroxybutyrate depolymerase